MILQGSPSHWPISNRKVALVCLKLNSGAKKKKTTETKIFKKMPFPRPKRWNLAEKDEPLTESYLFTHFQSKSCTNLSKTEFWHKKKTSTEMKNFLNCNFGNQNDRISLKNDDSPGESFPLTYFQSKSSTNFPQLEFWQQQQNEYRNENFEKNAMSKGETIEFGRKTMTLLWSPICWPISKRKVAPI